MKKLFTLAAAGILAAGTFTAQAQVTLDGQLTAAELTAGNYVLLGKFTNARGFGDNGLLSLYAASTSTKLYFFVGGTVQNNRNGFELFLDLPGAAGVPVGTSLPAAPAGSYFQGMTSKLDLAADLGLSLRSVTSGGSTFEIEGVAYTSATAAVSTLLTAAATPLASTGTPQALNTAVTTGAFASLASARMAYKASTGGNLTTNPGNVTPNTSAAYGGVGTLGWEIEMDRTAAGLTGTPSVSVFVVQNGDAGNYLSSDFIPQTSVPPTANAGNLATGAYDFTALPGRQAATITLGANGVLGTKVADAAAIALGIYPNPAQGAATVAYNVGSHADNVNIVLTDLLGREVQVLANGLQAAGPQSKTVSTATIAAGTYLVRVQVGEKVSTSKMVVM